MINMVIYVKCYRGFIYRVYVEYMYRVYVENIVFYFYLDLLEVYE